MIDRQAHAVAVTEALREEEPPLGLGPDEAICPSCSFAFFVGERAFSWGVCPDCLAELVLVPTG